MILDRSKKEMVSLAAIGVIFFISIALVESFALETNTDRPGMDYDSFDLGSANPSLCEQACNSDPDCRAFTYVKPGVQGPNAKCWLKNGIPAATPSDCCDSGVKGSTGVASADLTGVWNCDDGGMYYIRQLGTTIWWYGEHDPIAPDWSNVMRGTVIGSTINADWTDVPKGSIMQYGLLTLQIQSNNRIVATSKTGGFGGSVWTR
jgi:hypothetical protein